jgi:hypothetical protein
MIYIGAEFFSPSVEASKGGRLIKAALRAAVDLRDPFEEGSAPAINVIFSVPGRLGSCEWVGIRARRFTRKDKMLLIQIGVPDDLVFSPEFPAYLTRTLHAATAIAFETFRKKGLDFPLADAERLVQRICERLELPKCGQ